MKLNILTEEKRRATACSPATLENSEAIRPRGITPRTHRLAEQAAHRICTRWEEKRALEAAAVARETEDYYAWSAKAFSAFWRNLTPCIRAGELIVGAFQRQSVEDEGAYQVANWFPDGDSYVDLFARNVPEEMSSGHGMAKRGMMSPVGPLCHRVADFGGWLQRGCRALADEARTLARDRQGEAKSFSLAFAEAQAVMIDYARGYADASEQLAARCADSRRKAELLEIARICRKVPAERPDSFHEALQSLWFAYMVNRWDLGRIDQYLVEFYERDLECGAMTPTKAQELIECFMIKVHDDYCEGVTNVSSVHTLTLGGQTPDGGDACNALTRLFLQAIRNIRLMRPSIYIRCHAGTPDDIIEMGVEMLAEGLSEPSFYGDTPIVDGLVRLGIPLADARDYALGGCTEVVSPGKGNWGAPTGWINVALLVDETLRDAAGKNITAMDGFWERFDAHLDEVLDACVAITQWFDDHIEGDFVSSLIMPCCLKAGKDMAKGGAQSNMAQWAGVGLCNAANMLYAAEHLVFRKGGRLAPVFALLDAGDPAMLSQLKSLPKFGNDDPSVDRLANALLVHISEKIETRSAPLRETFSFGHLSGGQSINIDYGAHMGATLDGRKAGQPLADSLAGSHGTVSNGPTSLIRSLCALDHSRLQAGNISTLMLNRSDLHGPEGVCKIVALVKTFVAMGGSQLQLNMLDAATLRRAQETPDDYRGLMVRVAGYSADFTRTGKTLQDEIIARTEGFAS